MLVQQLAADDRREIMLQHSADQSRGLDFDAEHQPPAADAPDHLVPGFQFLQLCSRIVSKTRRAFGNTIAAHDLHRLQGRGACRRVS